jgi:Mg2+-importing ATPase
MEQIDKTSFWQFDSNYWLNKYNTTTTGYTEAHATKILAASQLKNSKEHPFIQDVRQFLLQFKSPLMLLLIIAVIISAFLGDLSDVVIILFIVLSTGFMSFFQERNASKVVEKLQSLVSLKSTVIRSGISTTIDSKKIICGDILELKAGDIIPADCLIIEENELQVNESVLTGESYPVYKENKTVSAETELIHRTNCLWEGTYVVSGKAKAIALLTGKDTILGQITLSTKETVQTNFEKGINQFGFFLMKITIVLSVFILTINLINHKNIIESALFALALAVGMAPELLPAITTIAMSAGAKRMLEKKVIVKKLASIQNFGAVDLLCTDKTGTITEGAIAIYQITNAFGIADEEVKNLAFWNASLQSGYENPIDSAIQKLTISCTKTIQKTGEIPYDFTRKRLSVSIHTQDKQLLISKGAFTKIESICTKVKMADTRIEDYLVHKEKINQKFEEFGRQGYRAIGICYKELNTASCSPEDESEMIFAGFILLEDPVKQGIIETIEQLGKLNIGLKIITGDNLHVATSIAKKIGIENPNVITGNELLKLSPETQISTVNETHIFAEVAPLEKEKIIQLLRNTYTVAYVGDGINDVSAIHVADVGISVENAVDIAKESADFVLMEKDLGVILDGIKEGRKTFANTLKYIFINTGSTFGNMFSMAVASLILPFLPMLPKQILLTNFLTDFPYLSIASDNVDEEQLAKPGKWDIKFIRNYMLIFGLHSSIFDVITFLSLYFILKVQESAFQTGWFIESILTELFILFIIRTHKNFFKSKPNAILLILSVLGLVTTILLPYSPLNKELGLFPLTTIQLSVMLFIVFCYVTTADILKKWYFNKHRF